MPTIFFVDALNAVISVDAPVSRTIMQTAIEASLPGILGECGGNGTCATCHVYVDEPWFDMLPAVDKDEAMMLEFAIDPRPESRLSCRLAMLDAYDGITVRTPASQV